MPTALRSHVADLASDFASSVILAIRGASLEEILRETSGDPPRRGPGRPRGSSNIGTTERASAPARKNRGRLPRRTPKQIAKALSNVVALVTKHPKGLRAEQIRAELKMEPKEMPRVLQEGLTKKQLKSKGQKRATVYSTT